MPDTTDGWIKLHRRLLLDKKCRRLSYVERYVWVMYLLLARWQPPFRGWLYDSLDDDPLPLSLRDRAGWLGLSASTLARIDKKLSAAPFNMLSYHEGETSRDPARIYIRNYPKDQGPEPAESSLCSGDEHNENECVREANAKWDGNRNSNCSGNGQGEPNATLVEANVTMPEKPTTDVPEADMCSGDEHNDDAQNGGQLSGNLELGFTKKVKKEGKGLNSSVESYDSPEDLSKPLRDFAGREPEYWKALGKLKPGGQTTRNLIDRYEHYSRVRPIKPVTKEDANALYRAVKFFKDNAGHRALEVVAQSNLAELAETGITFLIPAMPPYGKRGATPKKKAAPSSADGFDGRRGK